MGVRALRPEVRRRDCHTLSVVQEAVPSMLGITYIDMQ